MVQLLFLSVLMDNFGVHDVCILFRDQCYNEVKQDYKENNLIHKPNYVNDVDNNLRWNSFFSSFSPHLNRSVLDVANSILKWDKQVTY